MDNRFQVTLTNNSSQGVDELVDYLNNLYHLRDSEQPMFIMLNLKQLDSNLLPQFALHMRELVRVYPSQSPTYIAILIADKPTADVAATLFNTIWRHDTVQCFTQVDKAELWLDLREEATQQH